MKSLVCRSLAAFVALQIAACAHVARMPADVESGATLTPRYPKNALPTQLTNHPLIVVHATTDFDDAATARVGIDQLVARFKSAQRSVVYLVHAQGPAQYGRWYTADRAPDFEIFSEGGEHNLPLASDEVTVVGGFFGSYDGHRGCQTLAVRDTIRMHFETSDHPLIVHLPLPALYFYADDYALRRSLLQVDAQTPKAKLEELMAEFPQLFFLTDNFSDKLEFAHPYNGKANTAYRPGAPVDVDGYSFALYLNGQAMSTFGKGPHQVQLRLESQL